MTDHVLTDLDRGVLEIRLNRPEKKNALTPAMYGALAEAILGADGDRRARAIWITGSGDAFTSGNDVASFVDAPTERDGGLDADRFLLALATVKTPMVAAVNGMAIGVGATMLLHCDLVHAAESAAFRFPFTDLGVFPEAGSTILLPRVAGHRRAMEMFLLADRFDAAAAREAGMVNRIFADGELEAGSLAVARRLAGKPAAALRATKAFARRSYPDIAQAIRDESPAFAEMMRSPEAQEAFNAFLEKREPDFSRFD